MPELQNVITSASGTNVTATLSAAVTDILTYINTDQATASFNSIGTYTRDYVYVTNNMSLSNSAVYMNDAFVIGSNTVCGWPYLAVQTEGTERARFTGTGFGINTPSPTALLDVNGNMRVRATLEVGGVNYPSDPSLKRDKKPYITNILPPVYEFVWKATGQRDIGVMADEVAAIEPACVKRGVEGLTVDYPKLVVLCLAEIAAMRQQIANLTAITGP